MECKNCKGLCIKKGCQNRRQRYYCEICKLYQLKTYVYPRCNTQVEELIVKLNNEGVAISGIARITGFSKSHIVNKIRQIAERITAPVLQECQQTYEVDEMHAVVKGKGRQCYITYALNKVTKQVIDFVVGGRTRENIGKVIDSLMPFNPKKICTDHLRVYNGLVEKDIHVSNRYQINHIERFNLTLRTHLKRLCRRTICFSRSSEMLDCCLRIYFWSNRRRPV